MKKNNIKIGDYVLMTKKTAKWTLDNPEIYDHPRLDMDEYSDDFYTDVYLATYCLLGGRVVGKVLTVTDNNTCAIGWLTNNLANSWAYYEPGRDFKVVDTSSSLYDI